MIGLRAIWAPIVAVLCAALLGACQCGTKGQTPVELPTYAEVVTRYNARVEHLDRYWSDAHIRFVSVDREGDRIDEDGDGYLQVIRPRKLYLTIGKVGEDGFQVGSNDVEYWWIDVRNKTAEVGEHDRVDPAKASGTGLPIRPLDLLEVLGIMPLEPAPASTPTVTWSADRRLVLVRNGTVSGSRQLVLDPENYEPREVHLLDKQGDLLVKAVLSDSKPVTLPDGSWPAARNPTRFEIRVPSTQTTITLWLRNPEHRPGIKEQAFNFEGLLRRYGVTSVRRIDGEPAAMAPGP